VIAMQFEIAEDSAAELAEVFYDGLASGDSVEVALTKARLHLYGRYRTRLDWAIPVLFSRADDGKLFDVAVAQPVIESKPPPSPRPTMTPKQREGLQQLWRQALTAYFTKDWEQAAELLAKVAAQNPSHADVQSKLAEAQRQLRLQTLYAQVGDFRAEDQWQAALAALDEIEELQPNYPDPDRHWDWAEGRQRREQLYESALAACIRSEWDAAITALEELLIETPEDEAARQLLARAQAELASSTPSTRPYYVGVSSRRIGDRWLSLLTAVVSVLLVGGIMWAQFRGRAPSSSPTTTAATLDNATAQQMGDASTLQQIGQPNSTSVPTPSTTPASTETAITTGQSLPTTAPRGTTVSPDGRIAFQTDSDGNLEIYTMKPDGTDIRRLTNHPSDDQSPAWSPDGNRIAFVSKRDTDEENKVYIMDIAGAMVRRLTNASGKEGVPSWSPDGYHIAYQSQQGEDYEIYIANSDGSERHKLLEDPDRWNLFPAWSPDGSRIAFAAPDTTGKLQIYVLSADGRGQPQKITNDDKCNTGPSWSPDGKYIAFVSFFSGEGCPNKPRVYVVNADGRGQPSRLTDDDQIEGIPTWSPDGRSIAFQAGVDGERSIQIVDFESKKVRTVVGNNAYWPAWSPHPH